MERYRCTRYEALKNSYARPDRIDFVERDTSAQMAWANIGRDRQAMARALAKHMSKCPLCR